MTTLLKIILIVFAWTILSCSAENQGFIEKTSAQVLPTPDSTKIPEDENGYIINEDGWNIPKFILKDKKVYDSHKYETADGRKIKVYMSHFFPENRPIFVNPFFGKNSNSREIESVREYKGKNQQPYCYRIATTEKSDAGLNRNGGLLIYFFCDQDGDRKLETYCKIGCDLIYEKIPAWVK